MRDRFLLSLRRIQKIGGSKEAKDCRDQRVQLRNRVQPITRYQLLIEKKTQNFPAQVLSFSMVAKSHLV